MSQKMTSELCIRRYVIFLLGIPYNEEWPNAKSEGGAKLVGLGPPSKYGYNIIVESPDLAQCGKLLAGLLGTESEKIGAITELITHELIWQKN
jgi:hypothetical protein